MSKRFSAYLTIKNNTPSKLLDVQVVLRNEYTYLFQIGDVEKNKWSDKQGIVIDTGNKDYWTVTYKREGEGMILWIVDEELGVKTTDAGQNVEITIDKTDVKIFCRGSGHTNSWTSKKPS